MTTPPRSGTSAAGPALMRHMNQRVLFDYLIAAGPTTRPQLAKEVGLSLPTVIAALDDLQRAGLVREAQRPLQPIGRPAAAYEADPSAGYVVGVDIGRDWLHVLITDLAGNDLATTDVRNHARSAPALVDLVSRAVSDTTAHVGITPEQVTHTVIGSPGVLDARRGRVMYAANLPGWHRAGLTEALVERLGDALTIDNDANLAALAELSFGSGRNAAHFVYLHIGTGIGIGIVLDGQVYRGATGAAGEIGYLPIGGDLSPARPGHVMRGIMEEALAADAVVRYAKAAGMSGRLTAERVFAAARKGDAAALTAVHEEAKRLAQLVASISAFLDPELIVVGGGIGQNLDLLENDTLAALAHLTPMHPKLVVGTLGATAVTRGAVARGLAIARDAAFSLGSEHLQLERAQQTIS